MRFRVITAVALAYVGTVIGAGFASGQEVWQFFSRFGAHGLWGIVLVTAIFAMVGAVALDRGRQGLENFADLLHRVYSPRIVRLSEGMIDAFLFAGLSVAVAGGGSTLTHFGLNAWLGKLVTLAIILYIGYLGVDGVMKINALIVPYLIFVIVITSFIVGYRQSAVPGPAIHSWHWFLSALLYVSYNLFTAVLVLVGLGGKMSSRREVWYAAGLGGMILGFLLYVEHRVLTVLPLIQDLPMLTVANHANSHLGTLYAVSLWLALLTTGVGIAFVFRQRYGSHKLLGLTLVLILTQWSFQTLVSHFYPVMGSLSVILWLPVFVSIRGAK